jgi:Diaminopimelate decarboxylase
MNNRFIEKIINTVGTPVFVYDWQIIKNHFKRVYDFLPYGVNIYYSMKANPTLAICQAIKNFTKNIEVSSLGEIACALKSGFHAKNILFSSPGKTNEELAIAVKEKIKINVESIQEIKNILDICQRQSDTTTIMMRINPDFTNTSTGIKMSGVASQFGIDVSDLTKAMNLIRKSRNINFAGISVYMGSQILDSKTIISNTKEIINLYRQIQNDFRITLTELDVGGGFGVSYFDNRHLDRIRLKEGLRHLFYEYRNELTNTKISFESGRYLLAESGSFFTKILYQKHSKGKNYLICDGGFNNILLSSFFTREIRGNFPIELINERSSTNAEASVEYYISGPLCSPSDILGSKVLLPPVKSGDILQIKKVGAYGLTYSPLLFISHLIPAEVLINEEKYCVIRSRSACHDLFKNQHELPSAFL